MVTKMKDIATVSRTREILEKYDFTLKKSLGQNFLVDVNVIDSVLNKADIDENTGVIEVGPGIGSLTEQLAKRAGKVAAFEIDQRLMPVLEDTLSPYGNITLLNEDILKSDIRGRIDETFREMDEVVVVANLPYYITTPIIMNFLMQDLPIGRYYVMMQKEVGERISAEPNTKAYGSLSIAIEFYTKAKSIQNVPKSVFMPPPNVDSIIVELIKREEPIIDIDDEETFFKLTRGAFQQRRKTILNNYMLVFENGKKEKGEISKMLEEAGIDPRRRGESLSLEEFASIYMKLKEYNQLNVV